VPEVTMHKLGN